MSQKSLLFRINIVNLKKGLTNCLFFEKKTSDKKKCIQIMMLTTYSNFYRVETHTHIESKYIVMTLFVRTTKLIMEKYESGNSFVDHNEWSILRKCKLFSGYNWCTELTCFHSNRWWCFKMDIFSHTWIRKMVWFGAMHSYLHGEVSGNLSMKITLQK